MTVSTQTSKSQYTGNGVTTAFIGSFRILDQTHISVILTSATGIDTTQALTTNYTVSGVGGATFTVTFLVAPSSGTRVTIVRNVPLTQGLDLVLNDEFPSTAVEDALDKLTMEAQQLKELSDRALTLPPTTVSGVSALLPSPVANQVIGWNANANGLQNINAQTLASIVSSGTSFADQFTGNGTTTAFSLTANPANQANLDVSVGGIVQLPGTNYTWTGGTTLNFVAAPPSGTPILVRYAQALPQQTGDAAAVSFLQSGAGASTRSVQSKLRDVVSVKDFGAVGDGVTDDTAAMLLALQSGYIVDGGGLTYAITGTMQPTSFVGLRNTNFVQISPSTANVATLYIYALSNWFIENCKFNMGSTQNTGASDDSSKSALRVRNADGSYCENFRISNVTVYGDGSGSRIQVRQSKRFLIDGCLVRDGTAAFSPDPTNDIMNGFDISDCSNFTVSNCNAYNLKCVLSGSPTVRYTRGFLFTEVRDCTIVGCNSTSVDQGYDFSGSVISGTTPAFYEGNRRFTISGCTSNNANTWGFKFANVTHDGLVTGCIANDSGSGGYVISAPSVANTTLAYATGNIDFVGCKAVNVLNNGGSGAGIAQGFRVMAGSAGLGTAPNTYDTYPRGVRFRSCEVIDNQAVPTTIQGFVSDVTKIQPTTTGYNTNIASSTVSCSVGPGITTPFTNIGPSLCCVTGSAVQSIPAGSYTALLWSTNLIDNQGLHSTSANTDKIYIKEAGAYRISAQLYFAANATGVRIARILKNGSVLDRTTVAVPVSSASTVSTMHSSTVNNAVPGDYYSVEVFQNSGGLLDHANNEANFIVQKVD